MQLLSDLIFRRVGGSTGTNFFGLCWVASEMRKAGRDGSLVSVICDSGARYTDTYYNDDWLDAKGYDLGPWKSALERFLDGGDLILP